MERYFYGITVDYFLDDSICVLLFPTLTCGVFVFSAVSAPSPPPPPPACPQILTHTYLPHTYITQSHTAAFAHTSNHSLTHSLTHTHHSHYTYITHPNYTHHTAPQLHTPHTHHSLHSTPLHSTHISLTRTHPRHNHSHTHHSHHSAGGFCVAGAALGALRAVGWRRRCEPVAFACRTTWCSARGRMYALAPLALRRSAGGFCVAGAALGALQAVGCTPWQVSVALPMPSRWLRSKVS